MGMVFVRVFTTFVIRFFVIPGLHRRHHTSLGLLHPSLDGTLGFTEGIHPTKITENPYRFPMFGGFPLGKIHIDSENLGLGMEHQQIHQKLSHSTSDSGLNELLDAPYVVNR